MHYDMIVSSGLVVDGTGGKPFNADVAVEDGRIAGIGDLRNSSCNRRISAKGKCVAPGFIDAHAHDDRVLLSSPDMKCKISQGVTTVITGNCGISLAPLRKIDPPQPLNLLGGREWYRFESAKDYATELRDNPASLNCIILVGHSTLRVGVMERLDRAATKREMLQMEKLVDEAMDAGFSGLSTGLEYPPAICANEEEVTRLAIRASAAGGIYTTHMRNESDQVDTSVEETIRLAEQARIRTVISHHKAAGRKNWGRTKETLDMIQEAQATVELNFDAYPYIASSTSLLPQFVGQSERILITWSDPHPECAGADLHDLCDEWKVSLTEAINILSPAGAVYFQMQEEDLRQVLTFPGAMIGSDGIPSDSRPHPRLWGTFPRVIGHYSRDEGLFPLEDAVARMTGNTASTFGLTDRGFIRKGMAADLVIFDPKSIIDKSDFENPIQTADGIEAVFVNGDLVYIGGESTENRPGQLIRTQV